MGPIRLLVIETNPEVRRALATRLASSPQIQVLGTSGSASEGLRLAAELQPDVILLDAKAFNGPDGLEGIAGLLEGLQVRHTHIIVLATYADESERRKVLETGAARYLLKDIDSASLIGEIESVATQMAQ